MADHNTRIGSTEREIDSGTVLIGGVLREIESGLTLAGGVAREIEFAKKEMVAMTFTNAPTTSTERVVVNGESYTQSGSYEIEKGSTVQFSVKSSISSYTSVIRLNRTEVVSERGTSWKTYELVANTNVTVSFSGSTSRGYIEITTS